MNLVTPKAAAEHMLLYNKLAEAGLFNTLHRLKLDNTALRNS
jgi:hypothetical protein